MLNLISKTTKAKKKKINKSWGGGEVRGFQEVECQLSKLEALRSNTSDTKKKKKKKKEKK
jgi:hypothetical protein